MMESGSRIYSPDEFILNAKWLIDPNLYLLGLKLERELMLKCTRESKFKTFLEFDSS